MMRSLIAQVGKPRYLWRGGCHAHSLPGEPKEKWQTLADHHAGTAALASAYGGKRLETIAGIVASIHDIGKTSHNFQLRLAGKSVKVDHSTAACLYLLSQFPESTGKMLVRLLAYPLLGHHGGMPDFGDQFSPGTLSYRLSNAYLRNLPAWKPENDRQFPTFNECWEKIKPLVSQDGAPSAFAAAFFLRMVFSCLVDADWLDTERFCSPARYKARPESPMLELLEKRFFAFLSEQDFLPSSPLSAAMFPEAGCRPETRHEHIDLARKYMLQCCTEAAGTKPGFFTLTMPTGGGKTLSSMAFALRHARANALKRIIMVVPYTSIIEQNADILRSALGNDVVLEHHSNYIPKNNEEEKYRLVSENWDASVIVTTSVRFFESLFANHPSECRKLHNIADSVIILDEAQMLPVPFIAPCLSVLKELVRNYGASVILCSATQPAFLRTQDFRMGLPPKDVREIIPANSLPALFRIFERAKVEIWPDKTSDQELAGIIGKERQVLCIVNSRVHARELFLLLEENEANFHLSARMTPVHRSRVLKTIRKRLEQGMPCRVISTSLVECGVDISFPMVMRERNGLDVLAQSAGRCNREGKDITGRVICFRSEKENICSPDLNRRIEAFNHVAANQDLFHPETVREYFKELFFAESDNLDNQHILDAVKYVAYAKENCWQFEFASIAKKFRFIPDTMTSVIIETPEVTTLLKDIPSCQHPSKHTLNELQKYSVSVYKNEFSRMEADGRIEWKYDLIPILSGGFGYNEKTGLDVEVINGFSVASLLF